MTIEEKVRSHFMAVARIGEDEIDMSADLFAHYGLDSMKAVRLISDIEVEYDIDISEEDAQKIRSLNDVVLLIKEEIDLE